MIAIMAGTGALPGVLVRALRAVGRDALICEMAGVPVAVPDDLPRLTYRIETLGTLLADLRQRGVTEVCLAGAMGRPKVDLALIDALTWPLVPRMQAALGQGDDGALRALIAVIEESGLAVRAAHEIAPDLLPPAGVLSKTHPTEAQERDAMRAQAVHQALAAVDVGQACVVRAGQVIALEALPGTDWMLQSLIPAATPGAQGEERAGAAAHPPGDPLTWAVDTASDVVAGWADWLTGPEAPRPQKQQAPRAEGIAKGGLMFKAPKPGQDRRADLPVIGPATVAHCARAGLSAIVIAAGGVMVLDRDAVIRAADAAGMVLWVRPDT
jgi:UDP-2,3-diacylglucosamine hydrolase